MKRRSAPIDDLHQEVLWLLDRLGRRRWARRLRVFVNRLYRAHGDFHRERRHRPDGRSPMGSALAGGRQTLTQGAKANRRIKPAGRGPRACFRSKNLAAPCTKCGQYDSSTHVPIDEVAFYCQACCPRCSPQPQNTKPTEETQR